jgi:hypothetical protein
MGQPPQKRLKRNRSTDSINDSGEILRVIENFNNDQQLFRLSHQQPNSFQSTGGVSSIAARTAQNQLLNDSDSNMDVGFDLSELNLP